MRILQVIGILGLCLLLCGCSNIYSKNVHNIPNTKGDYICIHNYIYLYTRYARVPIFNEDRLPMRCDEFKELYKEELK